MTSVLPDFNPRQKRMLFLSSLGGVLEFYDFIIYIFLTPYIEKIFFADNSAYLATLKTLAIFSVGYLLRPIGGILFSHFGDRYGRKVVFMLTVLFMAIPSFAIGMLPTTAQIGIAAPLLLLTCRMMQGLALGGEIPAAITFVAEHVPSQRRAFALSTLFFGINLGLLLGSLITTTLTSYLSHDEILSFGWRIPFILGGFFGLGAIYLRRYLQETAAFTALQKHEVQRIPFLTLMRHSSLNVLQGTLMVALGAVSVIIYLYWPQYMHQYFQQDYATLMRINTLGTILLSVMILIGGLLSDRFGYRRVYLFAALALLLGSYPLFAVFNSQNLLFVSLSYLSFALIFGLIPGAYSAILCSLFPTQVRYSGIALSYNLAYALFGGLSPVICTIAIQELGNPLAPAFYCMTIAALAICVGLLGAKSRHQRAG